jgi:hypothetical protein
LLFGDHTVNKHVDIPFILIVSFRTVTVDVQYGRVTLGDAVRRTGR